MHGLMNRAIHTFLRTTYGEELWADVARAAGLEGIRFEAMLSYEDHLTEDMLDAAATRLGLPRVMVLEDLGTFLVSDPSLEALRRLMRFGGETFLEFLYSLEDLPDRVRLAVPDLSLPDLDLVGDPGAGFLLHCRGNWSGAPYVLQGVLRAMADDYGALAMLDVVEARRDGGTIGIQLLDAAFAAGRSFSLKGPAE